MFCRNCGTKIQDNQNVCLNCGNIAGNGSRYCHNCGAVANDGAVCCTQCGVFFSNVAQNGQKSKIAAGLLGIFLGAFGIHNFYLGYTGKALAQLLMTLLSCGILGVASEIWGLVEGIMILTGSINTDAKGIPLKD